METKSKTYDRSRRWASRTPWWFYILLLVVFYLLGWALHLIGIIPGQ